MKKIIFVFSIVLFVTFLASTTTEASHSWGNYHWARTANPFTLQLVDSVVAGWNSYLGTTSTDWSVSTALDTTIVSGDDSSSTRKRCPAVLGKDRICNATYGNDGWLGLAQVWVYSDGHIAQGVVKTNDTYFNTAKYNTPAWKNLVMCQEVGHTLGLDHQDEIFSNVNLGTCMDYTNAPAGGIVNNFNYGSSNEHPNTHDYDQLGIIYSHFDSFTSALSSVFSNKSSAPAWAKDDVDVSNEKEWGKSIRQSSDKKTSVFERDLGKGSKIFTFVIWAE